MTLDAEDVKAIASEVVRLLKIAEGQKLDAEFLASLPVAERKAIQQEKARRAKAEQKRQ